MKGDQPRQVGTVAGKFQNDRAANAIADRGNLARIDQGMVPAAPSARRGRVSASADGPSDTLLPRGAQSSNSVGRMPLPYISAAKASSKPSSESILARAFAWSATPYHSGNSRTPGRLLLRLSSKAQNLREDLSRRGSCIGERWAKENIACRDAQSAGTANSTGPHEKAGNIPFVNVNGLAPQHRIPS